MKILFGDFNAKVGRENVFNPTTGNESYIRIVMIMVLNSKLCHIKNLVVKGTMFLRRNIHKYTWTSPDGKTHNQIDHVLIDRRWHSNITDCKVSGELTVILISIWWLQKSGKE